MRDFIRRRYGRKPCPPHIWTGVSVEGRSALTRLLHLREIRSSVRFLSIEPLLEPIGALELAGVQWVIVGGESGPRARPMDPRWVREIRDQCVRQKVPFFFKQWGGYRPTQHGRLLDGRTWDEFPAHRQSAAPIAAE